MLGFFLLFGFVAFVLICEQRAVEAEYNIFKGLGIGASFEDFETEEGLTCREVQVVLLCFHVIYIFDV